MAGERFEETLPWVPCYRESGLVIWLSYDLKKNQSWEKIRARAILSLTKQWQTFLIARVWGIQSLLWYACTFLCLDMLDIEWLYTCHNTPHSHSNLSGVAIAQSCLLSEEHQSLDINARFIFIFLCTEGRLNASQCFIIKESKLIISLLEPSMSVSLLGGKSIWALTSLVQTLTSFL